MDSELLKDLTHERGKTMGWLAKEIGLSRGALDKKMAGGIRWNTDDVKLICGALKLTKEEAVQLVFDWWRQ